MDAGDRRFAKAYRRSGRPSAYPAQLLACMGKFSKDVHTRRYNSLKDKPFLSQRLVDWNELGSIGDNGNLREAVLLRYSFDRWSKVFECDDLGYKELTLEFLATFEWEIMPSGCRPPICSFRIMGSVFTLSLPELAVHAGFYTEAEAAMLDFSNLSVSFPDGVTPRAAWCAITGRDEDYVARKSKSTMIISPALRYLQHLLSHSLVARALSQNVVGWQDLISLYSMEFQQSVHLGYMLAFFFHHEATYSLTGAIGGAYYITRIAKSLGIWDRLPPMVQVTAPSLITRAAMVSFHLLRVVGKKSSKRFIVVMPGDAPMERPAEEEQGEPAEPPIIRRELDLPQPRRQSFKQERQHREQGSSSRGQEIPNVNQRLADLEANQYWLTDFVYQQALRGGLHVPPPPARFASSSRRPPSPVIIHDTDSDEE